MKIDIIMEKKQYIEPTLKMWEINEDLMQIGSQPIDDPVIEDPSEELSKDNNLSTGTSVWDD